ncbi:hypothetical protein [Schauerella aestuarii]|uniref:hypothetical protein n=1 Tax=Schauerella aestuarii TaxID=2511204 RepID=UPI0013712B63|nr:hypothetical protein [Achromobacter aestuarii]MYZ41680.1 hypothetical protein [Achromobacter aestuarii]
MPAQDAAFSKRHALKIALLYLVIRGIPEWLLFILSALPEETVTSLIDRHGTWLQHIYPIMPLQVFGVPAGFQNALAVIPLLVIEALFVFLFSTWRLRHHPGLVRGTTTRGWIVLIVMTLIWSCAIRHQFLAYLQQFSIDELRSRQDDAGWIDALPGFLLMAHWRFTAIAYATIPLWAWLPVWAHFRCAKKPIEAAAELSFPHYPTAEAVTTQTQLPLNRATIFASFLLGCFAVHIALVQAVYLGLWPWASESMRMNIPRDALSMLSLPLSLSQIGFGGLMCALAAYIYARRTGTDATSSPRSLVVKPLLAGIAAYVLTGFLLLAMAWLAVWLNPALGTSFMRAVTRAPESGIAFAIALNIGAMILLCLMGSRMRASPRRWTAVLAVLVVCAAVPSYVGWKLAGSNLGIAGGTPGMAVTGKLGDARWRNMEQWCTGVVDTAHGTWLVGRNETSADEAAYVPKGTPDLSQLLNEDDAATQSRRGGMFGSRPVLTTLARLQDDGAFKIVATVPDVACLVVSPVSDTLFLFTGMDRPESASSTEPQQTVVFRSTNHGASWEWMKSGFMSNVESLAWDVKPTFTSERNVWAWGNEPPSEEDESAGAWGADESDDSSESAESAGSAKSVESAESSTSLDSSTSSDSSSASLSNGETARIPTALFFSDDQGATANVVYGPEPLIAPASYLKKLTGQPTADFSNRRDMDQERFVVQIDDTHAYAWASEFMWYRVGEDSHRLMLTTRAELSRSTPQGEWQITTITRQPDVRVAHLSTSLDGRTYAVLQDRDGEWLAKLDPQTGEWIERQRTPALLPAWMAENRTTARYFWSNGDYQVVSEWGDTVVSRLLIPFMKERAEIQTDAHFYTRDGGRTWHQLAIPGYLGMMGLSPRSSKVYWSKGNAYSDDEALQWEYDLAK